MPRLKWPLIWLAVTAYLVITCILDAFIDMEADRDSARAMLPICFAILGAAIFYYRKRIEQRQQWRQDRFWDWIMGELPEPPKTDWESFEENFLRPSVHDVKRSVGGRWRHVPIDPSEDQVV